MSKLTARMGFGKYEADEYYRIALDAFRRNKLTDAIQNINYALMLLPANPEYLSVRAFFYLEDGVLDKCEEDVNAALKSNPYEVLANYCKGILHYQRREWEEAKTFFMNAWAADPQRAETQYYLALVLFRLEDYPNALRWMRQARVLLEKQDDKTRLRDADSWIGEFERMVR
jgi:tetratricopeptide (TPR) repeat protein